MPAETTNLRSLKPPSKDVRQFLSELQQHGGWSARKTSAGHIFLRHRSGGVASLSSTPSDGRAIANARAVAARIEKNGAGA